MSACTAVANGILRCVRFTSHLFGDGWFPQVQILDIWDQSEGISNEPLTQVSGALKSQPRLTQVPHSAFPNAYHTCSPFNLAVLVDSFSSFPSAIMSRSRFGYGDHSDLHSTYNSSSIRSAPPIDSAQDFWSSGTSTPNLFAAGMLNMNHRRPFVSRFSLRHILGRWLRTLYPHVQPANLA